MNYYTNYYHANRPIRPNNERVGFIGPFILGGITGGLLAPAFYRPYPNYQPYPPYPYFRPY